MSVAHLVHPSTQFHLSLLTRTICPRKFRGMSSCQRADGKEANNGDGSVSGRGKLRSDSKEDICVDHKGIQSQQERSEERGGVDPAGERSVSIFVENIPTRMHWKGLWHLFARHGDVYATYIARKLSRGGKRFGFVRFKNEVDAGRAMERLDGFVVYSFRLTVKLAIQKERNVASKKRHQSSIDGTEDREKSRSRSNLDFKATSSVMPTKKKISGHVENEDLWWLKRYVSITGNWLSKDVMVNLINVYAPCSASDQLCLWNELIALRNYDSSHWLIGGDFNATLNRLERSKCSSQRDSLEFNADRFVLFSDLLGVMDATIAAGLQARKIAVEVHNAFMELKVVLQ
ncbi:hypothetical protein V6N12_057509 [Hibiscus sabdariffa]|uniref:RRM domain-containing protein n=1 Tax=Hibiscus sabdariffa TaxID=183260 RepID=A0ABR2C5B9_9ROSI